MAFKTEVLDRIPTYPGRVKLTPVSGTDDTYDMVRADQPIQEGTPINKALFDQKAYTLTANVTVYVATTGSDTGGDGTSAAPYATIQKAINSLPKWLDGYTATIDIAAGTYAEKIVIDSFRGGRLTLGVTGRTVTVQGISIYNSSVVQINISNITSATDSTSTLLYVGRGSIVSILSTLTIDGQGTTLTGVGAEHGSVLAAIGVSVIISNTANNAVQSLTGSRVSFAAIEGSDNVGTGLKADTGGVISFSARNLMATTSNLTVNGGRIYTGAQTSIPNY